MGKVFHIIAIEIAISNFAFWLFNSPQDFASGIVQVNFTSTKGKPAGNGLKIAILILCSREALLLCFTIYFLCSFCSDFACHQLQHM